MICPGSCRITEIPITSCLQKEVFTLPICVICAGVMHCSAGNAFSYRKVHFATEKIEVVFEGHVAGNHRKIQKGFSSRLKNASILSQEKCTASCAIGLKSAEPQGLGVCTNRERCIKVLLCWAAPNVRRMHTPSLQDAIWSRRRVGEGGVSSPCGFSDRGNVCRP